MKDNIQNLIKEFFDMCSEDHRLVFYLVGTFIGTMTILDTDIHTTLSNPLVIATLVSSLGFLYHFHYLHIKKSIQNIGKSHFPFQAYQPEIKYIIALHNNRLREFNIKEEEKLVNSLKTADMINNNSELSEKGVTKAIEAKQTIRGRLVQYTAISFTALIIYYSITRFSSEFAESDDIRIVLFLSALLVLWIPAAVVIFNIVSRRELLVSE